MISNYSKNYIITVGYWTFRKIKREYDELKMEQQNWINEKQHLTQMINAQNSTVIELTSARLIAETRVIGLEVFF